MTNIRYAPTPTLNSPICQSILLVLFFLEIAIAKDNIGVSHVLQLWMAA